MQTQDLRVYALEPSRYAVATVATIGENIRRLREQAGFQRQGAFARELGVEQPRLSDWENNRYKAPEIDNLLKIAKVLKVSLNELLAGVDPVYDAIRNDLSDHILTIDSQQPSSSRLPTDEIGRKKLARSSSGSRDVHRPVSSQTDHSAVLLDRLEFIAQQLAGIGPLGDLVRTLERTIVNANALSEAIAHRGARAVTAPAADQPALARATAPESHGLPKSGHRKNARKSGARRK